MKMNCMKKMFFAFAAMLCFVSCGTSEKQVDAFLGEYTYESTGSADIYLASTKVTTVPLDAEGEMRIVRAGAENRVALVAYNDSIFALVNGDELILETTSMDMQYDEFKVNLVFAGNKAKMQPDSTILWKSDVIATATYGSYSATGNGNIELVATKKK